MKKVIEKKLFSAKGVCRDRKEYYELAKMRRNFDDRKIRPILICCGVLCLVMCVYDIIILEDLLALMSAGFAFMFLYPSFFSYLPKAHTGFEADKNKILNVGLYCDFYENRFTVTKKDVETALSYSKIIGIRQSKTKIYIFTDEMMYYIDKSLFEKGDSEELLSFLKEKTKKGK
ncbi:MAG: YcxB family protein [Oscillospiraceae bacterium]|nr:YcxB family protein [Oscillospiraceae bacterium]